MDAQSRYATVKRCTAMVMATLAPLAVGACRDDHPVASSTSSKGIDRPADTACTVFATGYRRAGTTTARLSLADEVNRYAARSDNGAVAGRAAFLGRSADRGAGSWRAASVRLLRACRAAGWKP